MNGTTSISDLLHSLYCVFFFVCLFVCFFIFQFNRKRIFSQNVTDDLYVNLFELFSPCRDTCIKLFQCIEEGYVYYNDLNKSFI